MINGKVAVYLLIISYIVTLGHNFIPHHHHQEGQENYIHFGIHHLPSEGQGDQDNDSEGYFCIFSNILHHNDNGLIAHATSENEYKSVTAGNTSGLLCENSVYENYTNKSKRKQPPEKNSYLNLQQKYIRGLRAPPVI